MAEAGEESQDVNQITFNVKSSSDSKYVITVPEDIKVSELKEKLSTSEYADVPAERQRLIYSGKVLKNDDVLSTYKIKDGNTVHMVKGAASNQRQQPSSSDTSGASNPAANVPSNLSTGTGTDPLAGLTGARYAGFAQLPGAESFGADGGMGPPQAPEDMLRMLENPMFQSQMNEAMNNPHVIQMMQNSPMVRNNPMLRQMLQNPEMRRMMMDPQLIRQSMQMRGMMGGGGMGGGDQGMPMPGVTDTTPASQQQQGQGGATGLTGSATSPPPTNPFGMLGQPGGQQGNPFAALFGGGAGMGDMGMPGMTSPPPPAGSGTTSQPQNPTSPQSTDPGSNPRQPPNPFASMFGGMAQQGQGQGQQQNPMASMAQQMMQNPEMMRQAMQMMGGMGGVGGMGGMMGGDQNPQQGGDQAGAQQNPFASLMGPGAGAGAGAGAGGNPFGAFGGMGGPAPAAPQDTRPPEEQYAEQLRQLNDMGFFEFDRNVRALRMAGGNVSGAIEMLLSGTI